MKTTTLVAIAAAALFTGAAHAQPTGSMGNPDFSDSAGAWDIEGVTLGKGNTIICKMQREAENGSPFADIFMISAGSDGFNVIDAYVTATAFPEGSSPKVAVFFDGKKAAELKGGVHKGLLRAELSKLSPEKMAGIIELFKSSKSLVEVASLKGHRSEKTTVDLADGDAAFDKRGVCSKAVWDIGMERMKNAE